VRTLLRWEGREGLRAGKPGQTVSALKEEKRSHGRRLQLDGRRTGATPESRWNVSHTIGRKMPESKPRKKAPRKAATGIGFGSGLLSQFQCEWIAYNFTFTTDSFDRKAFTRRTGLKIGERWNAGMYPTDHRVGYHIHFKGLLEKDEVNVTVEYWDGSFSRPEGAMPSAESIMKWIGSLVRESSWRAHVNASFEKPLSHWRSRFNLPFKVTMAGQEVTIDGVTLDLPKNPSHAYHAFLMTTGRALDVSVHFSRIVEFANFRIDDELPVLNEAVKILAEETAAS
jgi:hypothetical protein